MSYNTNEVIRRGTGNRARKRMVGLLPGSLLGRLRGGKDHRSHQVDQPVLR